MSQYVCHKTGYTILWVVFGLRLQLILLIFHPLCLLADFIVTGIPFCCGEFSGLDLHFGSFWRAIFGPGIFWVLLKTLGILRGLDFCLHLIILVVCNIPPLGLFWTLYVVFHSTVEKMEPMWKSLIVLYFFNPLLCTEYSITMLHLVFVITTWNLFWNFLFPCNVL